MLVDVNQRKNIMASLQIYSMVTERIVAKIEEAIIAKENGNEAIAPWHRPWFNSGIPTNLVSKKPYRGFNVFYLSCLGYTSPYFATFNQIKGLGGNVKKGEKGFPVIFWKFLDPKEVDPSEKDENAPKNKKIPMLRYYTVFNIDQTENINPKKIPAFETREFNPMEEGEAIIRSMPNRPEITHNESRACYKPSIDSVNMPKRETFESNEAYYSTLFHELTHSTGHASRLNRKEVTDHNSFGSHDYSAEELTAEMGAVFLCNEIGINSTFDNSIAYLKSWLQKFKDDTKMIIMASGRAQKAVDYILDSKNKTEEEKE